MNSRELILQRVRSQQPAARPLPDLPAFAPVAPPTLAAFGLALERMGGRLVEPAPGESVEAVLAARFPQAGVLVSAVPEVAGTRPLADAQADPSRLQDVDVAVVRAAFGVAETGSVALSEREFGINALGFLPQHLVVLLDPQAIVAGVADAYQRSAFFAARYATLMTGPSATADIEGVLIRGAQGIRSLTVIACAPAAAAGGAA